MRAHHARAGNAEGGQAGQLALAEEEAPRGGRERPGQHGEERALACAVGADQAEDLAFPELQLDAVDGLEAAEALRQSLGAQRDAHVLRSGRSR